MIEGAKPLQKPLGWLLNYSMLDKSMHNEIASSLTLLVIARSVSDEAIL